MSFVCPADFQDFWAPAVLRTRLCLQFNLPHQIMKWALGKKLSTFLKKPVCQSFLMDLLFVWKLTKEGGQEEEEENQSSSELRVEIDYSGLSSKYIYVLQKYICVLYSKKKKIRADLSFMWRSIIPSKSLPPADVSYMCQKKEYHTTYITAKSYWLRPKRTIFQHEEICLKSENSLRFTFNVSLGRETALKKVNGLFWTENWKNIQKTQP